MTERIRRTWRKTSPFAKVFLILMIALGSEAFLAFALDADIDGIDDGYEMFFGLNAATNDAALDNDGDTLSNYSESLLWTDPLIADTDRDGFPDGVDSNLVSRVWVPWGEPLFTRTNEMVYTWPPWMVSAFKAGGEWDTNIPAWYVAEWETNPASLNLEVDRDLLTNNLRMRMDYVDQSNATIFLDLYDTNEVTVATNLLDNLLTGGGSLTTRTFAIPLAAYTNAVGIRLRRDSGAVTICDNLLYVDEDGDGLDAEQERQLGTSDHDVDSDHDGFSDYEEVFTYGTDPTSVLSVPYGLMMGHVSYSGVQTGLFHMVAAADTGSWTSSWAASVSAPGAYSIFAPQRRTYFVKAFRDVNGNGSQDYWEPCGMAVPLSVYLTTATTGGVDVALSDPDSDGDGMSDAVELALGLNPYVSNSFARLPFLENFETNTVHLGDVNGQNGWLAGPSNSVLVQTGAVWEGAQALMIKPGDGQSSVCQMFSMSNAPVVWADAHILAWAGSVPTSPVSGSAMAFFDDNGYLKVYDGLSASTNKWVALTNVVPHAMTGEWVRLTMKLDYGVQRWLVCVDGVLAGEGLGFASPVSQFNMVSLKGERGGMDALSVSTNKPAGLSLDGDLLPDDWEMTNFGNMVQTDSGDADGDGLSNLEECRHGADPNVSDSDHDGMSDGWEVSRGFNPTNPADAALDADGDGLSNLGECAAGTDPRNAASHCWNIVGTVSYTGPQTGLIWIAACTSTTGWTVVSQASALSTGAYVIANVPPASNYWVKAWRDTDGNGSNDFWEACGAYTNHSISLLMNVTGINFALSDPDSDGDGMPDWWEIAHGFNPTNSADALQDTDGDGLNNQAEYTNGADPHMADTDHDGIADGLEVQSGSNPKVANNFAQFPFIERFETNTVHLGNVNGQNGWIATSSNTVMVQTNVVWEGSQALSIKAGDTPSSVCQLFTVTNVPVVWADTHILAWAGSAPTSPVSGSAMAFFDDNGYLRVYDGLSASTNKWVALTNVAPHAMTGEWVRLTMKLDYGTQRWLACVDGILARDGIGFATAVSQFNMVSLKGERGGMDALCVSTNEPAGLSLDGDLMPDDWERANFGNLDQTDNGDLDHDGLSNLEEYRHGTDPNVPDSDHDGMPDGWEVVHGFSPTNSVDAMLDADGDVLSNIQEYQHVTDPLVPDTDHDGLGDGVEVNTWHSNPLMVDSDGDDYTDADEVARGTDPADPASHPASHWLNHRKLTFREGSLTNRLADVPILVRLTPERVDYSQCATNGRDIFFTDSAGLPLDFEMERWKPGGESLFWVRLPEAGGTNSADYFWLHWNYPGATNAANAAAVWSTNYLGVWHLAETNAVLADSTPGMFAATNVGAVCVTGILGNARNFRGSDSVIVPPAALAGLSNAVSISFWQYGATNQPFNDACFEGTGAAGRELNAHVPWSDGNVYWDAFGNYDRINKLATTNLYKGGWNHWTFTKDRSTGTMRIYVNGELWHSGTGKTRAYTPVTAFRFGAGATGSSGYLGMMDEFRVESLAQSPDWIRFQYKAMLDQVLIYGEQQVSVAGTANGAEPDQAGEFTVTRTIQNTNFALSVNVTVSGGTATEGADFTTLPRSVLIPSGATQATFPVPVIDDLWLEGAETVTVAIAQGNYFISSANAVASISLIDDDVDSDADGLCDVWEIQNFGNLDVTPTDDADSDGVNNREEYLHGTNPHAGDTDQDGLPDQWEIASGTDPLTPDASADPDNDGLTNLQEYQTGTNPKLADTDSDGMPDKWELDQGFNPVNPVDAAQDADTDGLSNLKEFQAGSDPHNPDTDGDGLLDGAEVITYKTSPLKADTDSDGLPDPWEVAKGTNPLVNDAASDPDGDNLTNMQEYKGGTNPKVADTDGDGMDDGWEVYAHTDPLVADGSGWGTLLNSITINPVDTNAVIGRWEAVDGNSLKALDYSGSAGYNFDVSTQAVYVLEVAGVQMVTNARWPKLRIIARVDGEYVGQQEISATVRSGKVYFIAPLLTNGTHNLWLDWDNVYADSQLKITGIRLLNYSGSDNNTNGAPDWVENRLSSTCTWDPVRSLKVSPVCIEGNGLFLSKMKLAGTDAVLKHGAGNRWYANVPLSATNATEIQVSVEDGERVISRSLVWEQTDVLGSSNLMIRKGDALLLTAAPTGAISGTVTINIPGLTNCVTTVDAPVMARFNSNGTFTVTGSFNDGVTNLSKSIAIQVIAASFPTNLSAVLLNKTRDIINPGIPSSNVVVQGDSATVLGQPVVSGSGIRYTASLTEVDSEHYLVARLGNDGPVLDSTRLLGTWMREATTGFQLVDILSDDSKVWQTTIRTGYFPADGQIQVQIFGAGAMFEDGSHLMTMPSSSLDALGGTTYRIVVPPGCHICHHVYLVQNGASMMAK